MKKYNLALFCKTFGDDYNRFKILKSSIDKYNADKLPVYIVCPQSDVKKFNQLITGNEQYKIFIITDEQVLEANGLSQREQNWRNQQIIKLGFYKMGLCKHYAIFDSDCYFIQNFYFKDFMFDKNTPYICMIPKLEDDDASGFVKNYIQRHGKVYDFICQSQVFSASVLEHMKQHLLKDKSFKDIIDIFPYEFQWYGEWFLKSQIYPIYPALPKIKVYWYNFQYKQDKKLGFREQDFIKEGYIGLLLNNGWCHDKVYKPSKLWLFYKLRYNLMVLYTCRNRNRNFKWKFKFLITLPKTIIKELKQIN